MTNNALMSRLQSNNVRLAKLYESYTVIATLEDFRTCSLISMEAHDLLDANFTIMRQLATTYTRNKNNDDDE